MKGKENMIQSELWRDRLDELRRAQEEIKKYSMTMTQYELQKVMEKEKSLRRTNIQSIIKGINGSLLSKIDNLKMRRESYELYRKKEINSWDSAVLQSTYGVMRVLLEMSIAGAGSGAGGQRGDTAKERIIKLFKEVKESGDKYKLRAFTDLINGVITKIGDLDEARAMNEVRFEAEKMLNALRETPEIKKAKDEILTAFEEFSQTFREWKQVSQEVGEGDPTHPLATSSFGQIFHRLNIYKDENDLPVVELVDKDLRHT